MSARKSEFDGIRVQDNGISFRIEEHRIINGSVFNIKFIDLDRNEIRGLISDLQKAKNKARSRDLRNFDKDYVKEIWGF